MRVRRIPRGDRAIGEAAVAELDAALAGSAHGEAADAWRQLHSDIRALAPPIAPDFERRLMQRLVGADGAAASRRQDHIAGRTADQAAAPLIGGDGPPAQARDDREQHHRRVSSLLDRASSLLDRASRIATTRPPRLATRTAAMLVPLAALLIALFLVAPWRSGGHRSVSAGSQESASSAASTTLRKHGPGPAAASQSSSGAAASPAQSGGLEAAATAPGAASGRLEQLSAEITLKTPRAKVQETSDRVAQLASREGGFVQSSHVQTGSSPRGEAELVIHVPSAKLDSTLAAIGRLAAVTAESQSLEDITAAHESANQRLQEAKEERRALLSDLSTATTEEAVETLRARLTRLGRRIAADESSLRAISRRAAEANVEISIRGESHANGHSKQSAGGLTLDRGLHDALRVLTTAFVVLLLGAAAVLPLGVLLAVLAISLRSWRRYRRESVLSA